MKLWKFIMDRADEPSTWRGLVGIVTAIGVTLNPEQMEASGAAGLALACILAVGTKDDAK